jgi:hypothetical protein
MKKESKESMDLFGVRLFDGDVHISYHGWEGQVPAMRARFRAGA